MNYRDHIAESHSVKVKGFAPEIPEEPILFPKTPNVLIGPDEPIIIPKFLKEYNFKEVKVDYEAELAFIIKDQCKNVPPHEAINHIYGFTLFYYSHWNSKGGCSPETWRCGRNRDRENRCAW